MLNSLITSETRIKLLKKFFLNSNTVSHLRGLESELGESTNAIRLELNRFETAGLLTSYREGNKKLYQANNLHPLFNEIHHIILKETSIDKVLSKIVNKLGNLKMAYLTGDLARGKDSGVIEFILVGDGIDNSFLDKKIEQAEYISGRRVSCQVIDPMIAGEVIKQMNPSDLLLLWDEGVGSENVLE